MARNDGVDRTVARNRDLKKSAAIDGAQAHNERKKEVYSNPDIVPERTTYNVHFKEPTASYEEMFSELEKEKVISTWGLKPDSTRFCELVFDVNSAYFYNHGGYDFAKKFYADAYEAAVKIVGGEQYILSAVMHADERNRAMSEALGQDVYHYHLHVVYVPVVEKKILWTKRCKDPALVGTVKEVIHQISHSKKWASLKTTDEQGRTQLIKSYSLLQDRFFEYMRDAGFDDFERGERGSTAQHLSDTEFKVKKETERLENLQSTAQVVEAKLEQLSEQEEAATEKADAAQERVDHLIPKMQKVEELARAFTNDAAQVLPPPDKLESAKSYREKKAMPIFHKIIGVLRNVFSRYLDLKYEYERLQERYRMALESVNQLKETIKQLHEEKAGLSAVTEKYHALCRGFGKETVEARVQEVLEREAMEKQQKRQARRRHDRDSR